MSRGGGLDLSKGVLDWDEGGRWGWWLEGDWRPGDSHVVPVQGGAVAIRRRHHQGESVTLPDATRGQAPPGKGGAPGSAGATGSRGSSREAGPVGRCRDRLWAEGRPSRLEPVPLPSTASLLSPELPGLQARCHSLTRQANKGVVSTGPNPRPLFPPRWGSGLGAPQPSSALRARPARWGSADSGPNPLGAARPSR